jgi:DNA (cytosine-5)-methyltransferase 1
MHGSMNRCSRLLKTQRIKEKHPPRVLDLFAGGGFSLGFSSAGFEVVGAVEVDPLAAKSHALNFCKGETPRQFEAHAKPRDITTVEPADLIEDLSLGNVRDAVDVIIGGPPCQAFARVGRAKLREIASHPTAFLKDPRSNLYLRFLKYVEDLQPLALVMENVPDALNYGDTILRRRLARFWKSWVMFRDIRS